MPREKCNRLFTYVINILILLEAIFNRNKMITYAMPEPNIITVAEAAREKGCTRQALYKAVKRGNLNATRQGDAILIFRDQTYQDFTIREAGGRLHKRYLDKQRREDT